MSCTVHGVVCFPETRDLDLQTRGLLGGCMPEGRALVNIWKASTRSPSYFPSILLLYQLTNQLAQTFVCRSQLRTSVCHELFFSYMFLQSNAIYVVSQKSRYVYLFFHVDLCVHVPPTRNSMHIGMVAELVCITFWFDAVPWQTSSGVGTSRTLYIFCSQLIKPVLTA
jgi:hypothetical protein